MVSRPLVSIISPCYNGARYLPLFLESVIAQDYSPLEFVFVDDGSTDETHACFESYREQFKSKGIEAEYVYQENKGAAAAINTALARVHGEYLVWVDSDDILLPDNVSAKVDFLSSHQDCGFVLSEGEVVKEASPTEIVSTYRRIPPEGKDTLFEDLIYENNVVYGPGTIMVRMNALKSALPKEGIYESKEGQNWQLILPLAYNFKCGYINRSLFHYVIHRDSHHKRKRSYAEYIKRLRSFEVLLTKTIDGIAQMPSGEKTEWKRKIVVKQQSKILSKAVSNQDWATYCASRRKIIANGGKVDWNNRSLPVVLYHHYWPLVKGKLRRGLHKAGRFFRCFQEKTTLCDSNLCTGCGACRAVCPVNAIDLIEDNEGFKSPKVNTKACVHCGKCSRVCPIIGEKNESLPQETSAMYAAQAKDKELLHKSSSGGMFGLLAGKILENGGLVCGCAWQGDFKSVRHRLIESSDDLPSLLETKYLQSEITPDVYHSIISSLSSGRKVLFCGTPCQICGLNMYLRLHKVDAGKQLLRIALFCLGAPSPGVWRRFVEEEALKHGGTSVVSARFRDKRISWQNFSQVIRFSNGEESVANRKERNIYMKYFWEKTNIIFRKTCSVCSCKLNYHADITLGDFWGIEKVFPDIQASDGVSAVIIHTEHGKEALEGIMQELAFCEPVKAEDIARKNPHWHGNLPINPRRDRFFALLHKKKYSLSEIAFLMAKGSFTERLSRFLARIRGKVKL